MEHRPNSPEWTEYTDLLQRTGGKIDAFTVDDRGTLRGTRSSTNAASTERAAPPDGAIDDGLPVLGGSAKDELIFKGTLSRGGMGEIVLAEQRSLRREVAVKTVRGRRDDVAGEAHALLIEARVTGALEHPNIVPVHTVGQNDDGTTLLVMKRIEGQSWHEILRDGVVLSRDIPILMDVCRALHFAHVRGVVHRDVKPANVMVGSFGEVYLVDWGIAVAAGRSAPPDMAAARDVHSVAGTPGYMAPEMALPAGGIDARTDVFLIGATLHHVLTGRPPFLARTLEACLLRSARNEAHPLPDDVDLELASICRRAMAAHPGDRFASVDDVRTALATWVGHASARELCSEGEGHLARLRAIADDAKTREVQETVAAARFAFSYAMKSWPDSPRARAGLDALLELAARREVRAGHLDSARLLVAELSAPPADLIAALEALASRRDLEARSVEELARISHDHDVLYSERERARLLIVAGVLWTAATGVMTALALTRTFVAGLGILIAFDVVELAAVLAATWLVPTMRSTQAARTAWWSIVLGPIAITAFHLLALQLGLGIGAVNTLTLVVLGSLMAERWATDRRVLVAALIPWCGAAVVAAVPWQWSYLGCGAFGAASLIAASIPQLHTRTSSKY